MERGEKKKRGWIYTPRGQINTRKAKYSGNLVGVVLPSISQMEWFGLERISSFHPHLPLPKVAPSPIQSGLGQLQWDMNKKSSENQIPEEGIPNPSLLLKS